MWLQLLRVDLCGRVVLVTRQVLVSLQELLQLLLVRQLHDWVVGGHIHTSAVWGRQHGVCGGLSMTHGTEAWP